MQSATSLANMPRPVKHLHIPVCDSNQMGMRGRCSIRRADSHRARPSHRLPAARAVAAPADDPVLTGWTAPAYAAQRTHRTTGAFRLWRTAARDFVRAVTLCGKEDELPGQMQGQAPARTAGPTRARRRPASRDSRDITAAGPYGPLVHSWDRIECRAATPGRGCAVRLRRCLR